MVPRKVGSAWEVDAPAKLNLYLEVLGKRNDGFHELETLVVPVRIYDQLRWTRESRLSSSVQAALTVSDQRSCRARSPLQCEPDDQNLVLRAAKELARHAGIDPCGHFHLTKRIPVQAGMGGGSSDAAAALVLANHCWNTGYSLDELAPLAASLGSDVPFFLAGGSAICRGRGERVETLAGLPRLHFVVVKPPIGLSTAKVFGQLDPGQRASTEASTRISVESHHNLSELVASLRSGATAKASQTCFNRLEEAALRVAPELKRIQGTMAKLGCWMHCLTGSGSAYFGIARTAKQANRIARYLAGKEMGTVLATSSC